MRSWMSSLLVLALALTTATTWADPRSPTTAPSLEPVPDARSAGGEASGIVRVGNLTYAGTMTSKCFSDHFLQEAARETTIKTTGTLHNVNLDADAVFEYPLVIMSGEGTFTLTDQDRINLRRYVENGGLVLASASCSSPEWDRSFRAEIARTLPQQTLADIKMDHPMFHTVYDITELHARHGSPKPLQGVTVNGRLAVIYSFDGLNNTANTQGCCCCGGNEITNCEQVNVNILAYALTH